MSNDWIFYLFVFVIGALGREIELKPPSEMPDLIWSWMEALLPLMLHPDNVKSECFAPALLRFLDNQTGCIKMNYSIPNVTQWRGLSRKEMDDENQIIQGGENDQGQSNEEEKRRKAKIKRLALGAEEFMVATNRVFDQNKEFLAGVANSRDSGIINHTDYPIEQSGTTVWNFQGIEANPVNYYTENGDYGKNRIFEDTISHQLQNEKPFQSIHGIQQINTNMMAPSNDGQFISRMNEGARNVIIEAPMINPQGEMNGLPIQIGNGMWNGSNLWVPTNINSNAWGIGMQDISWSESDSAPLESNSTTGQVIRASGSAVGVVESAGAYALGTAKRRVGQILQGSGQTVNRLTKSSEQRAVSAFQQFRQGRQNIKNPSEQIVIISAYPPPLVTYSGPQAEPINLQNPPSPSNYASARILRDSAALMSQNNIKNINLYGFSTEPVIIPPIGGNIQMTLAAIAIPSVRNLVTSVVPLIPALSSMNLTTNDLLQVKIHDMCYADAFPFCKRDCITFLGLLRACLDDVSLPLKPYFEEINRRVSRTCPHYENRYGQ